MSAAQPIFPEKKSKMSKSLDPQVLVRQKRLFSKTKVTTFKEIAVALTVTPNVHDDTLRFVEWRTRNLKKRYQSGMGGVKTTAESPASKTEFGDKAMGMGMGILVFQCLH